MVKSGKKSLLLLLACFAVEAVAAGASLQSKLAEEPELTAKIDVSDSHNPGIVINGRRYPAFFYNCPYPWPYDDAKMREKIGRFAAAGLHLYTLGIESKNAWRGPGDVDYVDMEDRVYRALELDPDGFFIFVINVTQAPKWWIDANPDELIDYANGGVDLTIDDNSPMGRCRHPSMASLKWRKDFADYVRDVVLRLEASPVGKRIFGYRIDDGVYREWHYDGMETGMPDTGKAMTAAFRRYLAGKYGSDAKLRKAWNDADATIAEATPATKQERLKTILGGERVRDPRESAKTIDFLHCQQAEVANQLIACDQAVKEACWGRKICGNYYGYVFDMNYPAEAWHLELMRVLNSPYVDFNCSPCVYQRRNIDDAEFGRSLVTSYTLHGKLCILENDTRTVLTPGGEDSKFIRVDDMAQSVGALSRGLCQALTRNAGCWYLDWGQGWYNSPELLDMFGNFRKILDLASEHNGSVAEVVVVGDLESIYYHRVKASWSEAYMDETVFEMNHVGVPFDTVYFDDLSHRDVRDYKVYLFMNKIFMSEADRCVVERLRKAGKTLVWLYAPGYLDEHGHGVDRISAITGFKVLESDAACNTVMYSAAGRRFRGTFKPNEAVVAPSFTIVQTDDVEPLAWRTYKPQDDQLVVASRRNKFGVTEYYSSSGFMPSAYLNRIVREAGVHVYETSGKPVIWASESFVAINGYPGKYALHLPKARRVVQLLPCERQLDNLTDKIELELTDKVYTRLFYVK